MNKKKISKENKNSELKKEEENKEQVKEENKKIESKKKDNKENNFDNFNISKKKYEQKIKIEKKKKEKKEEELNILKDNIPINEHSSEHKILSKEEIEKENEENGNNNILEESFKKLSDRNLNQNLTFQSQNNKDEIMIEIKPIENYLREKMKKMKQKCLLNTINLSLQDSFNNIREKILNQKLKVLSTSRSLDNILENNNDVEEEKLLKNPLNLKILNNLIKQEKEIKNELYKLINNEYVIKNESMFNLTNPNNNIDKINLNLKLNKINETKENLKNRLIELEKQISNIIFVESKNEGLLQKEIKINVRNFLDNYEFNQEIFNKKIIKLQEESKLRREKMERDIEEKITKKKKEIKNKELEEEYKKQKLLEKLRNDEKNNIQQRFNINNQKSLKLKIHLHDKIQNINYSYQEKEKKYIENEEKLIKLENIKRKNVMKHINLKEFSNFRKEFEQNKIKVEEEQNNKFKHLKELWNERSKLIPNYISPFLEKYKEEYENKINYEKKKSEKFIQLKNIKLDYSKNKIPKVKKAIKSPLKEKEFDVLSKSKDYSKNIRLKIRNKKIKEENSKRNKITLNNSSNNTKRIKNEGVIENNKREDYLTKMRLQRNKSSSFFDNVNSMFKKNSIKKILDSEIDFHQKLNAMNSKLNSLDEQAKQKENLLRFNGGVKSNPDLGNEICALYLNSINTKLNIIENFENN